MKTSVNLRDGRIFAPIAFVGNYNPPLIGCVEFSGVAETNIVLEFDQQRQALIGRAQVTNVNLNGAGGIGGSVLARLVQSSIDQKINPIDIIKLDKVSVRRADSKRRKSENESRRHPPRNRQRRFNRPCRLPVFETINI